MVNRGVGDVECILGRGMGAFEEFLGASWEATSSTLMHSIVSL